jgi:glycosyltransferase involved in cell wall biosynthesis
MKSGQNQPSSKLTDHRVSVNSKELTGENAQYPIVSLVLPVKNEGLYISEVLEAIDRQTYPSNRIEIIIVDGGSTDNTLALIREKMTMDSRIRVAGGPGVNCPLAMNIGIEMATGTIVAKIDGHGYMNDEFIATAVEYLTANCGVSCVGGEIVPVYSSDKGRSNYLARFSKFGVGSGTYTAQKELQKIDTVQCGVYVKKDLIRVGLFDPDLQFGEDEEANFRLIRSGGKIVFHPRMRFYYHVRPSFQALYRQYFNYGCARVKVLRKHPSFLKLKHLIPAVTVLALCVSAALLLIGRAFLPLFAASWGVYGLFLMTASLSVAIRNHFLRVDYLTRSFLSLHIGYGLGLLAGCKFLLPDIFRNSRRQKHQQSSPQEKTNS